MRYRRNRSDGGVPPFVDPDFADALAGRDREDFGRPKPDHKTQRLCRQVQRVLNLVMMEMDSDEATGALYVAAVTPAPNASRLLVHVVSPQGCSVIELLERLERAMPRFRAEVAVAITRKRAPELAFVPARPEEAQP